jgi:branched-chain amino acid transport system substrate-binding protein
MPIDDNSRGRRSFLRRAAGATAGAALLSGCTNIGGNGNGNGNGGGGGGGGDSVRVPGLYDLSGGTSDVGRPTSIGSRDAITWLNENGDFGRTIDHPWNDYAYEVSQASQYYDEYTSEGNPPLIIGWGTADTEALAQQVAEDEIVYVSASYSANLLTEEAPYNFFGNLDYTSQARAHLKWIADNDSGAKIAFIFSNNPFGQAPVEGGKQYAEELGLEVGPDIDLPLTANSATSQLRRARDEEIDYLIHQNTAAPMQVLLSDRQDVYPDVTVCGLTYTVDEFRVQQSPEVFEGARYVNAFRSFQGALDSGGLGATIIEESFEREGRSMDNFEVANLNYVRGVIHALLALNGLQNTVDAGNDPTSGADVRQGMFDIEDNDMGGLSQPFNYMEDDRRPTMTGRLFEVSDGSLSFDTTVELPRREDWIGL